jgi:hypothetical protein
MKLFYHKPRRPEGGSLHCSIAACAYLWPDMSPNAFFIGIPAELPSNYVFTPRQSLYSAAALVLSSLSRQHYARHECVIARDELRRYMVVSH